MKNDLVGALIVFVMLITVAAMILLLLTPRRVNAEQVSNTPVEAEAPSHPKPAKTFDRVTKVRIAYTGKYGTIRNIVFLQEELNGDIVRHTYSVYNDKQIVYIVDGGKIDDDGNRWIYAEMWGETTQDVYFKIHLRSHDEMD